jgi:hypothetical protein
MPTVQRHIVVGNGQFIPAECTGQPTIPTSSSPLQLRDVLIAPHLVKNLISIRALTRNNSISVEFDPWVSSFQLNVLGKPPFPLLPPPYNYVMCSLLLILLRI